jgi:hypothetical protein
MPESMPGFIFFKLVGTEMLSKNADRVQAVLFYINFSMADRVVV